MVLFAVGSHYRSLSTARSESRRVPIGGGLNGGAMDAAGITITIISLNTEWKAALLLNAAGRDLVEALFTRFLTLASAVLDVINLAYHCADADLPTRLFAMSALISTYIFVLGALALLSFGPVALFLLGLAFTFIMPLFVERWVEPICEI